MDQTASAHQPQDDQQHQQRRQKPQKEQRHHDLQTRLHEQARSEPSQRSSSTNKTILIQRQANKTLHPPSSNKIVFGLSRKLPHSSPATSKRVFARSQELHKSPASVKKIFIQKHPHSSPRLHRHSNGSHKSHNRRSRASVCIVTTEGNSSLHDLNSARDVASCSRVKRPLSRLLPVVSVAASSPLTSPLLTKKTRVGVSDASTFGHGAAEDTLKIIFDDRCPRKEKKRSLRSRLLRHITGAKAKAHATDAAKRDSRKSTSSKNSFKSNKSSFKSYTNSFKSSSSSFSSSSSDNNSASTSSKFSSPESVEEVNPAAGKVRRQYISGNGPDGSTIVQVGEVNVDRVPSHNTVVDSGTLPSAHYVNINTQEVNYVADVNLVESTGTSVLFSNTNPPPLPERNESFRLRENNNDPTPFNKLTKSSSSKMHSSRIRAERSHSHSPSLGEHGRHRHRRKDVHDIGHGAGLGDERSRGGTQVIKLDSPNTNDNELTINLQPGKYKLHLSFRNHDKTVNEQSFNINIPRDHKNDQAAACDVGVPPSVPEPLYYEASARKSLPRRFINMLKSGSDGSRHVAVLEEKPRRSPQAASCGLDRVVGCPRRSTSSTKKDRFRYGPLGCLNYSNGNVGKEDNMSDASLYDVCYEGVEHLKRHLLIENPYECIEDYDFYGCEKKCIEALGGLPEYSNSGIYDTLDESVEGEVVKFPAVCVYPKHEKEWIVNESCVKNVISEYFSEPISSDCDDGVECSRANGETGNLSLNSADACENYLCSPKCSREYCNDTCTRPKVLNDMSGSSVCSQSLCSNSSMGYEGDAEMNEPLSNQRMYHNAVIYNHDITQVDSAAAIVGYVPAHTAAPSVTYIYNEALTVPEESDKRKFGTERSETNESVQETQPAPFNTEFARTCVQESSRLKRGSRVRGSQCQSERARSTSGCGVSANNSCVYDAARINLSFTRVKPVQLVGFSEQNSSAGFASRGTAVSVEDVQSLCSDCDQLKLDFINEESHYIIGGQDLVFERSDSSKPVRKFYIDEAIRSLRQLQDDESDGDESFSLNNLPENMGTYDFSENIYCNTHFPATKNDISNSFELGNRSTVQPLNQTRLHKPIKPERKTKLQEYEVFDCPSSVANSPHLPSKHSGIETVGPRVSSGSSIEKPRELSHKQGKKRFTRALRKISLQSSPPASYTKNESLDTFIPNSKSSLENTGAPGFPLENHSFTPLTEKSSTFESSDFEGSPRKVRKKKSSTRKYLSGILDAIGNAAPKFKASYTSSSSEDKDNSTLEPAFPLVQTVENSDCSKFRSPLINCENSKESFGKETKTSTGLDNCTGNNHWRNAYLTHIGCNSSSSSDSSESCVEHQRKKSHSSRKLSASMHSYHSDDCQFYENINIYNSKKTFHSYSDCEESNPGANITIRFPSYDQAECEQKEDEFYKHYAACSVSASVTLPDTNYEDWCSAIGEDELHSDDENVCGRLHRVASIGSIGSEVSYYYTAAPNEIYEVIKQVRELCPDEPRESNPVHESSDDLTYSTLDFRTADMRDKSFLNPNNGGDSLSSGSSCTYELIQRLDEIKKKYFGDSTDNSLERPDLPKNNIKVCPRSDRDSRQFETESPIYSNLSSATGWTNETGAGGDNEHYGNIINSTRSSSSNLYDLGVASGSKDCKGYRKINFVPYKYAFQSYEPTNLIDVEVCSPGCNYASVSSLPDFDTCDEDQSLENSFELIEENFPSFHEIDSDQSLSYDTIDLDSIIVDDYSHDDRAQSQNSDNTSYNYSSSSGSAVENDPITRTSDKWQLSPPTESAHIGRKAQNSSAIGKPPVSPVSRAKEGRSGKGQSRLRSRSVSVGAKLRIATAKATAVRPSSLVGLPRPNSLAEVIAGGSKTPDGTSQESLHSGSLSLTVDDHAPRPQWTAERKKAEGNESYRNKDYAEAARLYTQAIELMPENAPYYSNRSACHMMLGRYRPALEDAQRAVKLDPKFVKGWQRVGKCHVALGSAALALSALGEGLCLAPGDVGLTTELGLARTLQDLLEQTRAAAERGEYRTAIFHTDQALRIATGSTDLKVMKAEYLTFLGRVSEAEDIVNDILLKDNVHVDAMYVRGLCRYYQDNQDVAFQHFQQVLRMAPDHTRARATYKRAKLLIQKKEEGNKAFKLADFATATKIYTEALEIDEKNKTTNSKLYCNRGIAAAKLGKLKQSIADTTAAIELDESYVKAYLRRANSYQMSELFEEAVRDLEKVYKLAKTPENKRFLADAKMQLKRSKRKDYYKILGVGQSATEDEIKKAYRKKALLHHPDRHASATVEEKAEHERKFKELGEAHTVLTDQRKRSLHDSGHDVNDPETDAGGMGADFDASQLLETFFGGGGGGGNMFHGGQQFQQGGGHQYHSYPGQQYQFQFQ